MLAVTQDRFSSASGSPWASRLIETPITGKQTLPISSFSQDVSSAPMCYQPVHSCTYSPPPSEFYVSLPFPSFTAIGPKQQTQELNPSSGQARNPQVQNVVASNPELPHHDAASHENCDHCDISSASRVSALGTAIFSQGWPEQAPDTVCGWGSSEPHTRLVRKELSNILHQYQVKTLDDAGCGDLVWMSMVDLGGVDYMGYDIYERSTWHELRNLGYRLEVVDITARELRPADLLVCRDVFIHLPNNMILQALGRFRGSARLLLTTSYISDPTREHGEFSNSGRFQEPNLRHAKLDLTLPPFNLGQPLERIPEDSPNKYLGLWDISHSWTYPSGGREMSSSPSRSSLSGDRLVSQTWSTGLLPESGDSAVSNASHELK